MEKQSFLGTLAFGAGTYLLCTEIPHFVKSNHREVSGSLSAMKLSLTYALQEPYDAMSNPTKFRDGVYSREYILKKKDSLKTSVDNIFKNQFVYQSGELEAIGTTLKDFDKVNLNSVDGQKEIFQKMTYTKARVDAFAYRENFYQDASYAGSFMLGGALLVYTVIRLIRHVGNAILKGKDKEEATDLSPFEIKRELGT